MTYKQRPAVCSEIRTNTQSKGSAVWNFLILNLAVRKENSRL
jgi:hypothetical protein